MVAINIYFHPITGKFIPPAHLLNYRIGGQVMAFVGDVEKFVIIENFKIGLL